MNRTRHLLLLALLLPCLTAARPVTHWEKPAPQLQIVSLWRSDCAPCLHELALLPGLARAHPDVRFKIISLKGHITSDQWPPNLTTQYNADDETLFARYGDSRRALPFSVALNAQGGVCAQHEGILAEDTVNEWMNTCAA